MIPLIPGHLFLVVKQVPPEGQIVPVGAARNGDPAPGLPDELLHVDDHVGGPLDQGLVVGDIEDREPAPGDEIFQPSERGNVQIVGRLIQQQHVRVLHQQAGQLHLDPLAAGERAKSPVGQDEIRRQAELRQNVRVLIVFCFAEIVHQGDGGVRFRQHLRQAGDPALFHDLAPAGAVALHEGGIHDVFQ